MRSFFQVGRINDKGSVMRSVKKYENKIRQVRTSRYCYKACMGNLLSLGAKMCNWNLTEGRSRNCDFKCNLGTYFCGVWIVFM